MKRLIAFAVLSLALAVGMTGCAHGHLSRTAAKQAVITVAVITAVVIAAGTYQCANCNIGVDEPGLTR